MIQDALYTHLVSDIDLVELLGKTSWDDPGIYQGWRAPLPEIESTGLPYITLRVNIFPRSPFPKRVAEVTVDIWDIQEGAYTERVQNVAKRLTYLLDHRVIPDTLFVADRVQLTEDVDVPEDTNLLHRQVRYEVFFFDLALVS